MERPVETTAASPLALWDWAQDRSKSALTDPEVMRGLGRNDLLSEGADYWRGLRFRADEMRGSAPPGSAPDDVAG